MSRIIHLLRDVLLDLPKVKRDVNIKGDEVMTLSYSILEIVLLVVSTVMEHVLAQHSEN